MSKKSKMRKANREAAKQQKQKQPETIFINPIFPNMDDEGFGTLKFTPQGQAKFDAFKEKLGKFESDDLEIVEVVDSEEDKPKVELKDYIALDVSLDICMDYLKKGKFGKAKSVVNSSDLNDFIVDYMTIEKEHLDETYHNIANNIITIGKTFYEYDSKSREFISDVLYDGLMSSFLANGNTEPTGIATTTKKGQEKVDIKYELLHNNMNKAYIFYSDDDLPAGVKETTSINEWKSKIIDKCGLKGRNPWDFVKLELSPKIDGVSINGTISPNSNVLNDPQTRGDKNKSVLVKGLNGLKVTKDNKIDTEFGIQYEAFVMKKDMDKASEYLKLKKPYITCRHAASGIINRLCTGEDDGLLDFICLYPIETQNLDGTYLERMKIIEQYGIVPNDMLPREIIDPAELGWTSIIKVIKEYYDKIRKKREELSYAIDGIVITVVDDDYQKTIGRNERTNLYQIALKFPPTEAVGVVDHVELEAGGKGFRTPQVYLKEPVTIDGVNYDHIPVLSYTQYQDMDIREDSEVTVVRVGDVIPAISMKHRGDGKKIEIPMKCPYCGEEMEIRNQKLYCRNNKCKGNIIGLILSHIKAIGVKKIGVNTITDVIERYPVITNLYLFSSYANIELYAITDTLVNVPAATFIGSLGIPDFGPKKAEELLKYITLNELVNLPEGKEGDDILKEKLYKFIRSDSIVENIVAGLREEYTMKFISVYETIHGIYDPCIYEDFAGAYYAFK